jgi:hypothetical protein
MPNVFPFFLRRYNGVSFVGADDRPAFLAVPAGIIPVNLHHLNIFARFQALGQTNEDPAVWKPQWESAEVMCQA